MEPRAQVPLTDPQANSRAVSTELAVHVIRSQRRHKTSAARIVDGVIEVRIPAWLSASQEAQTVGDLVARLRKSTDLNDAATDLVVRSAELARQFGLPRPQSIRWVTNQQKRWGSCTPSTREIRISSRLRSAPAYVLDYVIVHELAHLVEHDHGPQFKHLEARFPQRERAEGFLEAMSLGLAAPDFQAD